MFQLVATATKKTAEEDQFEAMVTGHESLGAHDQFCQSLNPWIPAKLEFQKMSTTNFAKAIQRMLAITDTGLTWLKDPYDRER